MECIIGTGSALPAYTVSNQMLSETVDTTDEWIRTRTGICSRHLVRHETTVDLAAEAADKAVKNAGIRPEELDLIIVTTATSEQLFPCAACEVQKAIGAVNAGCFDLNAACSGFISAYQMAAGQIRAGILKYVLIVSSEVLSHVVDWSDRSTCVLFGDGAGAAVIGSRDAEESFKAPFILKADGRMGDSLTCNSGLGVEKPFEDRIRMDGQAIYRFAVIRVPEAIEDLLSANGMSEDEVDYYILHQANSRILSSIAKHLKQPLEKFPMNLQENGNISSASIPVLLDECRRKGMFRKDMTLVLAGFGAGTTWGAALVKWRIENEKQIEKDKNR